MILIKNKKYIKSNFLNEAEIEDVVSRNYEYLFGPNSIFLPKALIKTADGVGTIPDAFAIDMETKKWYLVEAELMCHNVWNHIAPQVTKQVLAAQEKQTRKKLEELIIQQIRSEKTTEEKLVELGIKEIDYRKVITEIFESTPIIGIPIDGISKDLRNWATTLKNPVRLWLISKYIDIDDKNTIAYEFPEEFKPEFDTTETSFETTEIKNETIKRSDITIKDLINANLLHIGQQLVSVYKPRSGNQVKVTAILREDGSFDISGEIFDSPSFAALMVLRKAGSDRNTVNGWTSWKTDDGKTIAELRDSV